VTGTDNNGCRNSDSITVRVTKENQSGYMMASGFTPNNDGLNDCYGIKYWGSITKLEFSIYNRWGQRVFFTTDPNGCWDGKINGVPQGPAVFVYMIRASTTCSPEIFRKGTFVLIR
jgi:gliding motility-associated-like protein